CAGANPGSVLPFGHGDLQAVHRIGYLDLATEPRRGPEIIGEVQHVLFGLAALAGQGCPGLVDVDMAGGAGALATAVAICARHRILGGRFHQRGTGRYLDRMAFSAERDVGDPGHGLVGWSSCWRRAAAAKAWQMEPELASPARLIFGKPL